MKYQPDCIGCSKNQGLRIFKIGSETGSADMNEERRDALMRELDQRIGQADTDLSPADLSFIAIRTAEEFSGNGEPFKEIKKTHNALAMELYPALKERIAESGDPLFTACQLSACGNIIDLGTQENFDIHATIEKVLSEGFRVNHFGAFKGTIETAIANNGTASLVYLCDNAGEIGFDRLFIEELRNTYPALEITAVVNLGPILNDAIMEDAIAVGLDRVVRVIDNGTHDLGTVLRNGSEEFLEAFNRADVIVSKGQANYETLSGRDETIFFILKAKCNVIARSLGVEYLDAVMADHVYIKESQLAAFG